MATFVSQPALNSDKGVVLEVGIQIGDFFGALVQPFATVTPLAKEVACEAMVRAFINNGIPLLTPCLSVDAKVIFAESRPMVHNKFIPNRQDFSMATYPGTRASPLTDAQVTALVLMYCGNNAPSPHGRLQIGKAFIPGLAVADNIVNGAVVTLTEAFEAACCNGLTDVTTGATFYRVGASRTAAGQPLPDVIQCAAATLIATQRRRLRRN